MTGSGVVTITETINIGDGNGKELSPDVVYLLETEKYLVVWDDGRNSSTNGYDIYAQIVTPTGGLAGSNYTITAQTAEERNPRLTLDGTGRVVVAWQRDNGGKLGLDVYGQRLGSSSALEGSSFDLAVRDDSQQNPALAGHGDGSFLVTWQDDRNGNDDVYARLVTANDTLGDDFLLHPATGDQENPQVAYNPDDDEYLVVWQDYRSGSHWDIYGQKVSGDGQLLGDENVVIVDDTNNEMYPQIAYGNQVYVVAWQFEPTAAEEEDTHVYGQVISRSGTAITDDIPIAVNIGSYKHEKPTDIVYNSGSGEFLVLWQYLDRGEWGVWGRHVDETGVMGTAIDIATTSDFDDLAAAGAYNADNDQYLIVWQQKNLEIADNYDVQGRRMTGSGTVTITETIDIASSTDVDQSAPDVVYLPDSTQYLVVWQNASSGTSDYDIKARRVAVDGTTVGSAAFVAETVQDEQFPQLALESFGGAMIVWQEDGNKIDLAARMVGQDGLTYDTAFTVLTAVAPLDTIPADADSAFQLIAEAWHTISLPLNEVMQRVLGPAGTEVTLTIVDPATGEPRDVTLQRAKIDLQNVTWQTYNHRSCSYRQF